MHQAALPTTLQAELDQASGAAPPSSSNEDAWLALWQHQQLAQLPPAQLAIRGGLLADRLPWVFISGYQAALKHACGALPGWPAAGWAAIVASEDRAQPEQHPGTRLTVAADGGWRLHGHKSWVAQSRNVHTLLVTARRPASADARTDWCCVRVAAASPGVHLSHRPGRGFLGAMSQGFARFDDVVVTADATYERELSKRVGASEAGFVRLAGAAFLLRHAGSHAPALRRVIANLYTSCARVAGSAQPPTLDPDQVAAMDTLVATLQPELERNVPAWGADQRLLTMYARPAGS